MNTTFKQIFAIVKNIGAVIQSNLLNLIKFTEILFLKRFEQKNVYLGFKKAISIPTLPTSV
jgi:hypothetical protein